MSTPSASPKSSGVSPLVLLLAVLLAVVSTAAVVIYLRPPPPPPSHSAGGSAAPASTPGGAAGTVEPLTQKDTVSPKRETTGKVFYPIPFAVTPSLKLTATKREYVIVTQDEFGFTWSARTLEEDLAPGQSKEVVESLLKSFIGNLVSSALKPGLVFEDFTWEAKGVFGGRLPIPQEQTGSFTTLPNTDGEVVYPIPYGQPAHVELSGNNQVTVTEMRANGFKWKNVTKKGDEFFGSGSVSWKARGVRGEGKEK